MKFACLTTVAPGSTLAAKCVAIAEAGCHGAETLLLPAMPLEAWQAEVRHATRDAGLELAAVIVGGLVLYDPDGMGWAREALHAVAEAGAAALITPEYRAQEPPPLFPPHPAPPEVEQAHVERALDELSTLAARHNMPLLLEPLTPFESRFWRDVATVAHVCRRLANPLVRLALDTHNMNITEASMSARIRQFGPLIGHVHLADNNRRLPGEGHVDFGEIVPALRDVHYGGWYSFECAVEGEFVPKVRAAIGRLCEIEQRGG